MRRKVLFHNFDDKHENKPNLYTAWSVYHFALSVFYFIRTKGFDEKNRRQLTNFVLE